MTPTSDGSAGRDTRDPEPAIVRERGEAPPVPLAVTLAPPPSARPSVIQLVFREKGALYAAYIPLFANGGLFVPTTRDYVLGDDIYLLLTLPGETHRHPVAGKVSWLTPANAPGGRTQGVGVSFPRDEKSTLLKLRIKELLGSSLTSGKPTQTI